MVGIYEIIFYLKASKHRHSKLLNKNKNSNIFYYLKYKTNFLFTVSKLAGGVPMSKLNVPPKSCIPWQNN